MQITAGPEINQLIAALVAEIQRVLGQKLIGVYLYGSLVWGDFDDTISDIDLLAATASALDDAELSALDRMHQDFVRVHPDWNDRIEIAYLSLDALHTFKTRRSEIAIISPGEPFHRKDAGSDWLINWYLVRQRGVTLAGPPAAAIIEPISKVEFLQAVQQQARAWVDYLVYTKHSRPYQGYAILTMCRALYAVTNGEQVSKRQAAAWAAQQLPGWSELIRRALEWRATSREPVADPEATFPETQRFVRLVSARIVGEQAPPATATDEPSL